MMAAKQAVAGLALNRQFRNLPPGRFGPSKAFMRPVSFVCLPACTQGDPLFPQAATQGRCWTFSCQAVIQMAAVGAQLHPRSLWG